MTKAEALRYLICEATGKVKPHILEKASAALAAPTTEEEETLPVFDACEDCPECGDMMGCLRMKRLDGVRVFCISCGYATGLTVDEDGRQSLQESPTTEVLTEAVRIIELILPLAKAAYHLAPPAIGQYKNAERTRDRWIREAEEFLSDLKEEEDESS